MGVPAGAPFFCFWPGLVVNAMPLIYRQQRRTVRSHERWLLRVMRRKDYRVSLERFNFEKGETRGGGTAPPGPK